MIWIMGETKKRWRPSLGAYRALENEVSELREQNSSLLLDVRVLGGKLEEASDTISNLVRDCDAWRDKYRELRGRGFWSRLFNR